MSVKIKGTIVADEDKWIYEWSGIDATCPKDVLKALELEKAEEVVFEINSGGGDVIAGNEIYYIINTCEKQTRASIIFAASAATIIACGAKIVDAVPSALYMVHNVSGYQVGDYNAMNKMSTILQNANVSITNVYKMKTGMTEKQLLKIMDEETWMDTKKAKEYGFIDEIIGEKNDQIGQINFYNGVANILSGDVKEKIKNMIKNQENQSNNDKSDFLIQQKQLKLLKMKGELR